MKTDVKKVLSLVLRQKKTGFENLSFSRARVYISGGKEREREERRRRVVLSSKASSSLGPLLCLCLLSSRLSKKVVQKRERRTFPIRHFITP